MPELPEVQSVVKSLQKAIIGKTIDEILEHRSQTLFCHCDADYGKVRDIHRRGKYIIIDANIYVIIHLRMTGKLSLVEIAAKPGKYTRAEIIFTDGTKLLFDDVRTFGTIVLVKNLQDYKALEDLGIEPLSDEFTAEYLQNKIRNRTVPIKNLLIDQFVIAGIGNIYANEILYRAKIDPRKPANKLNKKQIETLVQNTRSVLREAIEAGGTTVSDYRGLEGRKGEFQKKLQVYKQEYCNCGKEITRIKQSGRSTFFCENCQK